MILQDLTNKGIKVSISSNKTNVRVLIGVIKVVIVFALMWLLTCSVCGDEPFKAPPNTLPEQIHGNIEIWAWNIAAAALMKVTPQFKEEFPNVNVNVNMTMANVQSRFLLSLAAGSGAPDVMQLLLTETPRYASTKQLMDLTSLVSRYEKDFMPSIWKSCMYKGRVYAIPWGSGPCAIFYKHHIFQRYGIDPNKIETWDDYIAAGKLIAERSNGKTKMFHLPTGGAPSGLASMFEMLIQQNGGQIFDDNGRIIVNSPQCLQVVELLERMLKAGIIVNEPLYTHAHYASLKSDIVATYPMAAWWGGTIRDYAPETAGDWRIFRLPALEKGGLRTSNSGGSVLVIPDQCKQKKAAWAYVEFVLCRPDIQNIQYKAFDLIPCLISSFNDPFYDEPDPFFGGQQVRRMFTQDIEKIYPLNRNKDYSEAIGYVTLVFGTWVARGIDCSPEEVLVRLEKKLQQRLNREISPLSLTYKQNKGS